MVVYTTSANRRHAFHPMVDEHMPVVFVCTPGGGGERLCCSIAVIDEFLAGEFL